MQMGTGTILAIAIIAALVIGAAASYYFWFVQKARDESAAGIVALSALSWRVFIHMVLDALGRRGYQRVVDKEDPSGDRDYILQREGQHWLLSCKHGSAFVLGKPVVLDLANEIRLKSASGGFLLTQGKILPEAQAVAGQQRIELLDGQALWPELRDLIPEDRRKAILTPASDRARQRILLSWLLALLVGVALFLLLPKAPASAAAASSVVDATGQAPAPAAPAPDAAEAPTEITPEILARQREDVLRALSTLPDVDRVAWSSQSTLQVELLRIDGDAFSRICPLMERYPAVATSRIQLTPPPGSGAMVRFRQCRTF